MKTKVIFLTIVLWMTIFISSTHAFGAMTIVDVANPGTLTGRVSDVISKQPMKYVTVVLFSAKDSSMVAGTISNQEGNFSISMLDSGKYYVEISFIGFEKKHIEPVVISSRLNKINLGEITLAPVTADINEVIVNGTKSAIEYKVDKRVVNVDKNMNAQGGTAVNALENTPSVQVDAQGNLTLRGSSDYIVLIDGKPSVVKGSDALKQLPANAIKQIEVITNPSAKYDVDGNAGIINVIMKKDKLQGLNGNLSVSPGYPDIFSTSALINYRKGKVNFFTGFDFADRTYHNTIDLNNITIYPEGDKHIEESIDEFYCNDNTTFRAGIDYDPNEINSFSISGTVSKQGYDRGTDAEYHIWQNDTGNFYSSSNYFDVMGDVLRFTGDYKHNFREDHFLSFSAYFGSWKGLDENNLVENNTDENYKVDGTNSKLNFNKDNSNYQVRTNIDYTLPVKKGKFEFGGQYRYESRNEDLQYQNYDVASGVWIPNYEYSYTQDYENTIYSGYAIYSGKIQWINFQVGLRSEYFTRTIEIGTENTPLKYNKFMVYPSIHLSKEINEKHTLQANYSRRINRPEPYVLNNTPIYVDPYNIFKGNPNLKFEYSDNFEINYRTTVKKVTFSTQTYFRNTTNSFTTLRLMGDDGIMIHQLSNAENQTAFGIEQEINFTLTKWWQLNTNANIYSYTLKTILEESEKTQKTNTWEGRIVSNFNFKTGTRFQATAYYRAPGVDAMGETSGFFSMVAAVNQSLFKGKMNIGVTAQNLLNSMVFDYSVKTKKFDNNYHITSVGPVFTANLTYNFNNFQNKKRGRDDAASFKGGGAF